MDVFLLVTVTRYDIRRMDLARARACVFVCVFLVLWGRGW